MEGPFIFEKTTTIVTFECGLEKNEEGSHHLQWESLGLPSTLPALPFLQSALCISFRSFTKLGRRKGHSEVLRLCLALLAKQIHIKQTKKKRKKLKKEQLSVLTQSPNFVLCYVRPHVLDVISCQLYVWAAFSKKTTWLCGNQIFADVFTWLFQVCRDHRSATFRLFLVLESSLVQALHHRAG